MRWPRLAVVLGILGVLGWGAWQLRESGPGAVPYLPGCYFRKVTGLDCPGCGMTRGMSAALNGRFGQALALNPLGMILLPLALIGLAPEVYNWTVKRPIAWRLRLGRKVTWAIVVAVFAFWVLRNTPWWPLPRG
jgi:hypothetical protein